jgi:hypothetical protein
MTAHVFREMLPSPALAIRFEKVTPGQLIHVECKVWFKGVVHDRNGRSGMVRFDVLVDGTN